MGTCAELMALAENMNVELAHFRLFFLPLPKSTAVSHHGRRYQLPWCSQRFTAQAAQTRCFPLLLTGAGPIPDILSTKMTLAQLKCGLRRLKPYVLFSVPKRVRPCSRAGMGDCERLGRVRPSGRWGQAVARGAARCSRLANPADAAPRGPERPGAVVIVIGELCKGR